ncbi:MAG: hypothetical protein AUH29_05120 [Candidatus Rokubacteria bacterium 13_1_40CM_69_27]|nr:MAG: hypothetical protein AUH29_05120 [Candidatus Rokubacteria bacterium 13_1_40CM_69_27]OLC35508.1 MAG: hypothetical protein AUH81_10065 [Candidatus Rokubacteria bacterium 13_1_40CM_4_69_5]OLE36837.1 MAG: hypothetical protein AUG00_09750 [Candidatus Rokubacteria bacterium 13_1_20CM_2_70_7]
MTESFDLAAPDHFTVGAIGPAGQRVFYLQGRQAGVVVTLKVEKEHVRALGEHLAGVLARPPAAGDVADDVTLLEPVEPAWIVASLAVGYDADGDRIVIVARELVEEGDEPAAARFRITRGQAAALVERARALMKASRPICPMCTEPKDPGGHVCPRANGHVVR